MYNLAIQILLIIAVVLLAGFVPLALLWAVSVVLDVSVQYGPWHWLAMAMLMAAVFGLSR